MTGLLLTSFNRPQYLEQTLESLRQADLQNVYTVAIDDGSTPETIEILRSFNFDSLILKRSNTGLCKSLRMGFDLLSDVGCSEIMNLDSDVIVRPDFVSKITTLVKQFTRDIATGFNTQTVDAKTHKPRHPVYLEAANHYVKKSIGGVNMCMRPETYRNLVRPYLIHDSAWDWQVCKNMSRHRRWFYVTKPSVIQHIGEESTFKNRHNADKAFDYDHR
jgi:glycosyltransferase involved in cell wall biosynthesis